MTPSFPPAMTPLGPINWIGLWTLYAKEVRRFMKVFLQTVAAPVISTMLFLAIFALAMDRGGQTMNGVPFSRFLVPGLAMMSIIQNAFANTSSSLLLSKLQGNIVDILMPPLSPWELTLAYVAGGATRGLVVGLAVILALLPFCPVGIENAGLVLLFALEAAVLMSAVGVLTGIWADKFDHSTVISNFVIMPLSFLSGTFYSIDRLPPMLRWFSHINPFFFMIDGFRAGFIGVSDGLAGVHLLVLTAINLVLLWATEVLFRIGYKLKA